MSFNSKKEPNISQKAVDAEISVLAGETSSPSQPPADIEVLISMFKEQFQKQDEQHKQLLSAITEPITNVQSMASASIQAPPQQSACPSQPNFSQELYAPEEGWEEVEGDGASSEDDEKDLEIDNWDFPASGKITASNSPDIQNEASTSSPPDTPMDKDLFNMYGLKVNWPLAPELVTWLNSVSDKEVPLSILKQLNETFVPNEELQPLFTAPALPLAISRLLYTAPKSLSRGPKIINSSLLRVQRELCIGYKPILEVLNFFYSEAYKSLTGKFDLLFYFQFLKCLILFCFPYCLYLVLKLLDALVNF